MTGQQKQAVADALNNDIDALTLRLVKTPNQSSAGTQATKVLKLIEERQDALATLESLPTEE